MAAHTIVLNPYSELAAVHTLQGLVMVMLGVLLIAGVDAVLHPRGEDLPAQSPHREDAGRAG